jgi:hypothetical protein
MDKLKMLSIGGTMLTLMGSGLGVLKGLEEGRREQQEKDEIKKRISDLEERIDGEGPEEE